MLENKNFKNRFFFLFILFCTIRRLYNCLDISFPNQSYTHLHTCFDVIVSGTFLSVNYTFSFVDFSQSTTIQSRILGCEVSQISFSHCYNMTFCSHSLLVIFINLTFMIWYPGFRQYFVDVDDTVPQKVSFFFS